MSQFEFQRSLEILAKRIGLADVSQLVLKENPDQDDGEAVLAAVDRAVGGSSRATIAGSGAILANVRDLSDLDLENMKALLKVPVMHRSGIERAFACADGARRAVTSTSESAP